MDTDNADGWKAAIEYTKLLGPLFAQRAQDKLSSQDKY